MGSLYVVATPIGNLGDMTSRAIETLKNVDIILCEDTRTSLKLLNHFDIKNKCISYHKFNEYEKIELIVSDLKSGKKIALISDAGTPCISDPGYVLIKRVREEGIPVFGIGGISACTTALSISGLNTDKFGFLGFFPRESSDKSKLIKDIKFSFINTFVFYESPKRIVKTLEYIYEFLGNVKISVFKELTKIHEKNYFGDIKDVIEILKSDENVSLGEYTFIIEKEPYVLEKGSISIEALLIDEMVKNNCSLKDAINKLNSTCDNISKKDIYNASLNLKTILERR